MRSFHFVIIKFTLVYCHERFLHNGEKQLQAYYKCAFESKELLCGSIGLTHKTILTCVSVYVDIVDIVVAIYHLERSLNTCVICLLQCYSLRSLFETVNVFTLISRIVPSLYVISCDWSCAHWITLKCSIPYLLHQSAMRLAREILNTFAPTMKSIHFDNWNMQIS